jgi:hypothetical protein
MMIAYLIMKQNSGAKSGIDNYVETSSADPRLLSPRILFTESDFTNGLEHGARYYDV